jgi:hypothetical protein
LCRRENRSGLCPEKFERGCNKVGIGPVEQDERHPSLADFILQNFILKEDRP